MAADERAPAVEATARLDELSAVELRAAEALGEAKRVMDSLVTSYHSVRRFRSRPMAVRCLSSDPPPPCARR